MRTVKTPIRNSKSVTCPVCGLEKPEIEVLAGASIRPALLESVRKRSPGWTLDQYICRQCLNHARTLFMESTLIDERGELGDSEREVIEAMKRQELVALPPSDLEETPTFGMRLADKIAEVGGSWIFIIGFFAILVVWIGINSSFVLTRPFDPFPFVLLNLVLSCLAAIQAPVIMMSQNRKEVRDRYRAESDYKTNLKAELEIRHLHIKLDQLISHQWRKLLEIQQVQLDLMQESGEKTS